MTRVRFAAWIGVVAWVVLLDPVACGFALLEPTATIGRLAVVLISAGAVAMAGLILTTPPDAIRLRPARSVECIGWTTAWVYGISAACAGTSGAAVIGAAVVPLTAVWLAAGFARRGLTPWWAGVLLWQPAVIGPAAVAWPWVAAGALLLGVVVGQPSSHELAGP